MRKPHIAVSLEDRIVSAADEMKAEAALSNEMATALEEDGAKLLQMTGEDHGPHFGSGAMRADDEFNGDITEALADNLHQAYDAEQQDQMAVDHSRPIPGNLPATQPEPPAPPAQAPDIKTLVRRQRDKMQTDLDMLTSAKAALEQRSAEADARRNAAVRTAQEAHAAEISDIEEDLAQIAACKRSLDLAVAELNKAEPK